MKKSISVIGLGNRGTEYMGFLKSFHGKKVYIHSLCDIRQQALDDFAPLYNVPKERQYLSTDEFFSKGVVSDALIISTQDASHYEITKAALETGYKYILLEKPVSGVEAEYKELNALAKQKGALLVICHVLRYSNYYIKIKEIIESGQIGDIVSINHTENVGYFHFAHSFVRGNWRDEFTSTPSILAKCCHDLDLISWFVDSPCVSVSSVGELSHFKKENAPKGATPYCMGGCKVKKDCPYDAERLYITDPFYKATFVKYHKRTLTGKLKNTKEDIIEAVRSGDYGRCVYMCDNNVCDSQKVTMRFENGAVAMLEMLAFTDKCFRQSRIVGTKGELVGHGTKLTMKIFGGKTKTIHTGSPGFTGHVEGDLRIVSNFVKILCGEKKDLKDVTTIEATIASHDMALAAERSRKNGGIVVELSERVKA
ncbi:MAG: Gfo/Idh/MocA family oxidoreductase [Oscillospiraceae bacterium]|nr:Gfo/Idh/MocA family oxidoreductase [Oscillospiraceae bacterium]